MELLKKLCVPSVCGYENALAEIIKNQLEKLEIPYVQDSNKTVVAHIEGKGPATMFVTAMDTPGALVTFIEENGFLRLSPVGGTKEQDLALRRIMLQSGEYGVVSAGEKFADMFIDTGADSKTEAMKSASVGDCISLIPDAVKLGNKLTGYRIGKTAIIYSFMKAAEAIKHSGKNIYFVFVAKTTHKPSHGFLNLICEAPEYAYLIGTGEACDFPEKERVPVKLGAGITLRVMDGSIISSPAAIEHAEECAKGTFYREITDKKGFFEQFHSSAPDTHTAAAALPVRYSGSPAEVLDVRDMEALIKFILSL